MKKKIFLGGYINCTNAQNINCLSLARYLDKEKYDIYSLTISSGDNNINDISINLFNCFRPLLFTKYIGFLWGVLKCEILYLPKHREMPLWVLRFAILLGKKMFTTIELIMCDASEESMISNFNGMIKMKEYFSLIPNIYGISNHLINESNCGIKLSSSPLYLGVDNEMFTISRISCLSNIVFIGSLIKRKNVDEILELAFHFRDLTFHIIGKGPMREELQERATSNVIFYGKLIQNEMLNILNKVDLHILLSRTEGFPKVILETASAGIPSLVYNDYGAEEWIQNNKNGFVLDAKEEVPLKIQELIDKPDLLIANSKQAIKLADKFSWTVIIKAWENEIERMR